jgi:hypothetical protein
VDDVRAEAAALLQRWQQEDEERIAAVAQAKRENLERRRDDMRAGRWKPHQCPVCVEAVLQCIPSTCPEARRLGRWWDE